MNENTAYGATEGMDEKPPPAYYPDTTDAQENLPPPPSYTQSQNEAPPPTYDSIFGELRAAQQNSEGRGHFLKSVATILINTTGFTIGIALLFAIPVLMIVVGAINVDHCPLERLIPIWLIVGGSSAALIQLMSIIKRLAKKRNPNTTEEEEPSSPYNCLSGILFCFNIGWFFAGNVWVYRDYSDVVTDNESKESPNFCDHTTYYLSFWLITTCYIIIFLFCCCSCCIALCAGSGSSDNN